MPEQLNTFEKGLNLDANPNKQPENTYNKAINFVRLSDKGDYYSFTNEKGTEVYCNLSEDFSVIGQNILESDIILFLVKNDLSASQIGIVDSNGTYTIKLDDINNELTLDLDHPIDVQSRTLINSNRVVYFVDNKNPIRSIDLDSPPAIGDIGKLSDLVPKSDFPTVDNFLIKDSSTSLNCGAYQFSFRYLDNKGNITNISIPSALVSIGQGSVSSGMQYQGGYNNILSAKSITLTINNIDTDYRKLEIIAIYYVGDSNILTAQVAAQLDIISSSTTYEYKGDSLFDLTIEEIEGITTNYSTAKAIEQKDGRLFISNLKENNTIEATLQEVANHIKLKYEIENLSVTGASKPYTDGNNNAFKVTYKRGEIYSYSFGVVYKNGAKSFAYHIPSLDVVGTPGTIVQYANTGSALGGYLGTYLSTLNYPTGQDYPDISNGYTTNNIRYHVMPTFAQEEPYTISDINNGTVNLIKITPEFDPLFDLPDEIKNTIQGIYFARRSRNSSENTSIFAQGIANYMMDLFDIPTPDAEDESGTVTSGGNTFRLYNNAAANKYLTKSPFMGGISLGDYIPHQDGTWDGSVSGNDGMQTTNQPNLGTYIDSASLETSARNGSPNTSTSDTGYSTTTRSEIYKDLMVFYTPESELLPKIEANTFTKIRRVASSTFTDNGSVRWNHSEYQREGTFGGGDGETEMLKYSMFYNSFSMTSIDTSFYDASSPITISRNYYVPRNTVLPTEYGINIVNSKQEEYLFLQTSTSNTYAEDEYTYKNYSVRNNESIDNDATTTYDQTKNIYELISDNTSQYGSVAGQEYVLCRYIVYDQIAKNPLTFYNGSEIYGGDTYITRIAFTNKSAIKSKAFMFKTTNNKWFYPENAQTDSFGREYIDIRSVIEYYVETSKNTDLRHSLNGGNLYYRYSDIVGTLIPSPEFVDDAKSYNNQYDFENRVQLFNSKPDIATSSTNHFKTRTIWSDQTILGELRDRYRDIRVDNFYDIPYNTGEIWDTFVFNNILYLHTPKTLWKTFVNAISQSASTAGQVTLGTGGVFPIDLPPQQVITQQGGYAGTISQWGGSNTPFGYIFPDSLQGKIFILGEGLEEISANGMIRFMYDNLSVLDDLYTGYRDNPFKFGDRGILSAFDFELKRWIITKNHEDPLKRFTLSYDVYSKQWCSFHTYQPNILISRDNRLFGLMNIESVGEVILYQHNVGDYGVYYNNDSEDSTLSIVINAGSFSIEKVFDNIVLSMDSSTITKIQAYRGTNDNIQVYNDRQHTGVTKIIWNNTYGYLPARDEIRSQLLRNNYNIKIPLNSLISDNNAIFDTNGDLILSNIDQTKLFRDRIKGNYCIIEFNFKNTDNYKLTLNGINTIFREYKR